LLQIRNTAEIADTGGMNRSHQRYSTIVRDVIDFADFVVARWNLFVLLNDRKLGQTLFRV
jgi:hypothetical protein